MRYGSVRCVALVVLIFEDGVLALRDTGRRLASAARRRVVGNQDANAVDIYSAEE
jgi:hypothetical protein